jgi:MFS family permease
MYLRKEIFGLMVVNFLFAVLQVEFSSLFIQFAADFSVGVEYLGFLLSSFIIGYIIALIVDPFLYTKTATYNGMILGSLISGSSTVLTSFLNYGSLILIFRAVGGFGYGLFSLLQ